MRPRRTLSVATALAAVLALPGCVAAAIPIVAGSAILRTGTDGRDAKVTVQDVLETPRPEPEAAAARLAALDPGKSPAFEGEAPAPVAGAPIGKVEQAHGEFLTYAAKRAMSDAETGGLSAMLADSTSLDGKRKPCESLEPTVLIDLDPAGSVLASQPVPTQRPALAKGLAGLRHSGIAVAWISGQSAAYAGSIRDALAASGLDPDGDDPLILMRYPGDRKQTRREEFAASSCLIAIAGDERADFDELFDYLIKPEAALGLDLLIGDGWFLVPPLFPSDQRPKP